MNRSLMRLSAACGRRRHTDAIGAFAIGADVTLGGFCGTIRGTGSDRRAEAERQRSLRCAGGLPAGASGQHPGESGNMLWIVDLSLAGELVLLAYRDDGVLHGTHPETGVSTASLLEAAVLAAAVLPAVIT